jgi:hypothetical protein
MSQYYQGYQAYSFHFRALGMAVYHPQFHNLKNIEAAQNVSEVKL